MTRALGAIVAAWLACVAWTSHPDARAVWDLPPRVAPPAVPADAPVTPARIELGRRLFYDKRLSGNGTQSCATCHVQERAFTDGRARGLGSTGALHPRGPMSLVNVAYRDALTWANPNMRTLEVQTLVPLFGEAPVELGLTGHETSVYAALAADPVYTPLFAAASCAKPPRAAKHPRRAAVRRHFAIAPARDSPAGISVLGTGFDFDQA